MTNEVELFESLHKDTLQRMQSQNERRIFELEFTVAIGRLKKENGRYIKSIAFAMAVTLYSLVVFGLKWTSTAGIMLLIAPYLIAVASVHEMKDFGRPLPLDQIMKKVIERDTFANSVWAIAISSMFAMILWYLLEGRPIQY